MLPGPLLGPPQVRPRQDDEQEGQIAGTGNRFADASSLAFLAQPAMPDDHLMKETAHLRRALAHRFAGAGVDLVRLSPERDADGLRGVRTNENRRRDLPRGGSRCGDECLRAEPCITATVVAHVESVGPPLHLLLVGQDNAGRRHDEYHQTHGHAANQMHPKENLAEHLHPSDCSFLATESQVKQVACPLGTAQRDRP